MPKNIRVIEDEEDGQEVEDSESIVSAQHLVQQQGLGTNSPTVSQSQPTFVTVIPSNTANRSVFMHLPWFYSIITAERKGRKDWRGHRRQTVQTFDPWKGDCSDLLNLSVMKWTSNNCNSVMGLTIKRRQFNHSVNGSFTFGHLSKLFIGKGMTLKWCSIDLWHLLSWGQANQYFCILDGLNILFSTLMLNKTLSTLCLSTRNSC